MENTNEQSAPSTPQPPAVQAVPYSTSVLVLGIIAIVGCFCWGIPGLVCGIIALTQATKGKAAYALNPAIYTAASLKNLNAGRICAIIGVCLSAITFVTILVEWIFFGLALSTMPWHSLMR